MIPELREDYINQLAKVNERIEYVQKHENTADKRITLLCNMREDLTYALNLNNPYRDICQKTAKNKRLEM